MKKAVLCLLISFGWLTIGNAQVPDLSKMTLNFKDVTETNLQTGFAEHQSGNEKHIAFADYDQDGDLDVAIAVQQGDFGQRNNKLYRNDMGVLVDVAGSDVMPEFSITDNSCTMLFEDFDNDGWPDLIVACDSNSGTSTDLSPGTTKYYRNVNGEYFVNETSRLDGLRGGVSFAAAADFDKNGFLDIVLCDHPNINQDKISFNAFLGNSPGVFQERTNTHLPIDNDYGKHVATADMNGDGKIDILMASHSTDDSFIYYNNNNGAGSADGDFRYVGSGAVTELPSTLGGIDERGMVPCDFNNDGLIDMYFFNAGGFGANYSDAIYVNIGNDQDNKAVFQPQAISSDLDEETMKVTTSDLDNDGREDLIVMARNRRPYVYRNTSENGAVSFVEWTHPTLNVQDHDGWEAAAAQLTGDARQDLLVGSYFGDFLFEGTESQSFEAGSTEDGTYVLPDFYQQDPIAVTGSVSVSGEKLLVASLPGGARVSVLMRSFGDMSVAAELNGVELASSNNSGHGSDEWLEFEMPETGSVVFRVTADAISFDGNFDNVVNLLDVGPFIDCLTGNSQLCDPFDLNDNGSVNLSFVSPFLDAVTEVKTEEEFVIEFLGREN